MRHCCSKLKIRTFSVQGNAIKKSKKKNKKLSAFQNDFKPNILWIKESFVELSDQKRLDNNWQKAQIIAIVRMMKYMKFGFVLSW